MPFSLLIPALLLAHLTNGVLLPLPNADTGTGTRGVTAVLLNWARLKNVVGIVANLCSPDVDDVVRSVVVWNNNPNIHLTHYHFATSACPENKLNIVNSDFNAYFQARFLACSAATTEFCFLQDDDYLVRTEVIRSMYTYLSASPNLTTLHLLPPHEHLTTTLRTTFSQDGSIHTGFAWLGHGALLRRSASSAFLELLGEINLSDWEMKMADNYYTILSNAYPEIWMDNGIPLDGTGAFTVGDEGDERNWDHIWRALRYFKHRLAYSSGRRHLGSFMHIGNASTAAPIDSSTAVCLGAQCTITTNINRLPDFPTPGTTALQMREHELVRRSMLGNDATDWLMRYPLANAVDSDKVTMFRSQSSARAGDYVFLDVLTPTAKPRRLHFVVDAMTRDILRGATFELSQDGNAWVSMKVTLTCTKNVVDEECVLHVLDTDWRFFRCIVHHDMQEHWTIFDLRLESDSRLLESD